MTRLNLDFSSLNQGEQADILRASYFILEANYEAGEGYLLSGIEDAEDDGGFAIHIGLPDRPDRRFAFTFDEFEDAVEALAELKHAFPAAGYWLSTLELLVEIQGADIWRGVVEARASCDPTDPTCDWVLLSAAIAAKAATGTPIAVSPAAHPVVASLAARL
ncbi:hypothetical protein SAMN05216360_12931 [Methylobacterium phyllostachyos]|uniref:Uncharacterized protein n=1 Tax=Methylobacterium phyllostachyos TaxID=582672 RepID=A0A1H0KVW9_9HYPH|nr:hypothetical protein [Methylobacterium phyllostachyos]SDO59921.1 hypothetical protein SAMN05216360_12931 [Methylobacterium phyllostachyos]